MDKEKLAPWIERLNKAQKNERNAIVEEMAKENGLKVKDAYKLLRDAGFDPDANAQNNQNANQQGKTQPVILRHKTEYPRYRRAGLVLTQKAQTYEVTEDQLAALQKDPWVVVGDEKKDGEKK
jgi:hypothetical protein